MAEQIESGYNKSVRKTGAHTPTGQPRGHGKRVGIPDYMRPLSKSSQAAFNDAWKGLGITKADTKGQSFETEGFSRARKETLPNPLGETRGRGTRQDDRRGRSEARTAPQGGDWSLRGLDEVLAERELRGALTGLVDVGLVPSQALVSSNGLEELDTPAPKNIL